MYLIRVKCDTSYFTPLISPGAANSLYERSCILFNYAAVCSQIAASQNLDTDDGLKIAAKYFQVSYNLNLN